ncbi:MAG: aminotransferase class I/II-fold pyridoxal phosphate-dependent enzyme [Acidobacteriota bacterium]
MQLPGKPIANLQSDAKDFINLYSSLGERAENFLPKHIVDNLRNFVDLCCEEPDDPARQRTEIDKYILELKELIPGYTDVSLMLFPHEDSKAFQYRTQKQKFTEKLISLIDTELVDDKTKAQSANVLKTHDSSIGTPPVTQRLIDQMYKLTLGDDVRELRKFRDVIGVNGDIEEAQWNYFMDVLEQMIIQSTHYTTNAEKKDFLSRTELTVNFKGLNGFIRTVVGGGANTVIDLLSSEVFNANDVRIIEFTDAASLYEEIKNDMTNIFVVKAKYMRTNVFNNIKWFPYLTRIIIVDDSPESRSTNTSLVFCFHNKIINTLNKVHTKKLGSLANTQLNLRLIIDKVNDENLEKFRKCAERKIADYEDELNEFKKEQLGETDNLKKDITLFKFNDYAKQIIKDKYAITKLHDYIVLIQNCKDPKKLQKQNKELIHEFETRTKAYFYSNIEQVNIATIVEGGGRSQLRTYGEYLLNRTLKTVDPSIVQKCKTIIDIIPNNFQRTLKNHFHKNFGINLFLEKYKEYITKVENESNNKGRFTNFLIDIGINDDYQKKSPEEQQIIKEFISNLANLDITSIADDVQMIIRDILFHSVLKPYILFNAEASWEYKDLFPVDRFDINPFDLEVGLTDDNRIDFERLYHRLNRMKNTFQLFDDTGNLWDRFCENLTIIINDPSNPSGHTDFNNVSLIKFLKFLNNNKITLLLDEAYSDAIKIDDPDEPKWRTISRYVMNNIGSLPNISIVSSLSTTKNLGATGNRLGSLIATPARKDLINFAKKQNGIEKGNTNSLYMLVNTIEAAQLSKKIKDRMESELPKDASRYKIKALIENYIIDELVSYQERKSEGKKNHSIKRYSPFEGSPLHIFLLEELASLNKLDVLGLPDDFKYKGEPFYRYYQDHIVKEINKFRVNKLFRQECNKRLQLIKNTANDLIHQESAENYCEVLESDGSYLFNILLKDFFSYQDLEKFTKKLASQRGIAVIPYQTGFLRFSLGDYLEGTEQSYDIFVKEIENSIRIVLKYWKLFYNEKSDPANKDKSTDEVLKKIFKTTSDMDFVDKVLEDYNVIKNLNKAPRSSLTISDIMTLYHAFPKDSGVTINTIRGSKNSVFEFYENIGSCTDLKSFISSRAFTKIYENLLPQIYKTIPLLKNLDYNSVVSRFGKATIIKYINNKVDFQPNSYVLDDPDEKNIMKEILIEMERILFSDSKVKILALNASGDPVGDKAKLEGINRILRKYIEELLLHFNLPFEQEGSEPSVKEIIKTTAEKFEEITGKQPAEFGLATYLESFASYIASLSWPENFKTKLDGFVRDTLKEFVLKESPQVEEKILRLFLLKKENRFQIELKSKIDMLSKKLSENDDAEVKLFTEDFVYGILQGEIQEITRSILTLKDNKITQDKLHDEIRASALFFIELMNKTKATEYYNRYNHTLIKFTEAMFLRQNSSINEMIQHGITLHKDFKIESPLEGDLEWVARVMSKCGVIGLEQPVQTHTRIATDAKKRIYPFHKADRPENGHNGRDFSEPNEYIKSMDIKPASVFFGRRMEKFIENMDENDYRCKIIKHGLVKVLYVFQKSYLKYLTDNFRLIQADEVTLEDVKNFMPDVILFYGAPEKVMSFPQIGYFDLKGPNGNIKTMVTPLKKEVDYFGDIKKPWLTMMNEKVKEMGGVPVHGSLFAVEEEDGSLFVVQVDGDSGVGKSEMLAAMMLKWLKKDLQGIRSIKMIAGDMFYIFPDEKGDLYGIGTEEGDFSRVTDFDPDFIKYYYSLFAKAADSNVEDLNSRSTISGLCDITMPFKIDIMLTASNYARAEAGITRYENPENFLLYRDSHGERKEKATSSDNPHLQRTLLRYTGDKNIVDVMDRHGNYIDDVLDWEKDEHSNKYYLCASYKMIDKIDIEDVVNKIFAGKTFKQKNNSYKITKVNFDIIKNKFISSAELVSGHPVNGNGNGHPDGKCDFVLDKEIFNSIFNSLASTPAGQPFVAEEGQMESRKHLINILKGGKEGNGRGRHIRLGILSTDLGRKGKEITGPQAAAEDMKNMIHEVRIFRNDINKNKNYVQQLVYEKYSHIFEGHKHNSEVCRYNFMLFQLEEMRKARFVRIDDLKKEVDLSGIKGFKQENPEKQFSPLLVTPNINAELNSVSETYEQLMSLPSNPEFAEEFYEDAANLYIAEGYSKDTIVNNMVLQILIISGYLNIEDLTRGRITEKVNRETLAAAKFAAVRKFNEN